MALRMRLSESKVRSLVSVNEAPEYCKQCDGHKLFDGMTLIQDCYCLKATNGSSDNLKKFLDMERENARDKQSAG